MLILQFEFPCKLILQQVETKIRRYYSTEDPHTRWSDGDHDPETQASGE